MKITVRANAKLNLTLDVVGKRDDDYHLLESVMQSVSLCDTVTVKTTDEPGEISVYTSSDSISDDRSNIAWKAADAFFRGTGKENPGIDIRIKKRIPTGAGMAGGSADGAAVIIALNELLDARLEPDELCDIGETVGADVPFCLTGGTMLARGTGNILTPLPDLDGCYFVIVKPDIGISTAAAYKAVDKFIQDDPAHRFRIDNDDICEEICSHDIAAAAKLIGNAFEEVLHLPEIEEIKKALISAGALNACMTGSGSAVFGIFDTEAAAEACRASLPESLGESFFALPSPRGCEIED